MRCLILTPPKEKRLFQGIRRAVQRNTEVKLIKLVFNKILFNKISICVSTGKHLALDQAEEICYTQILGRMLEIFPGNITEMGRMVRQSDHTCAR